MTAGVDARVLIVARDDSLAGPLAEGLDRLGWRTITARGPYAAIAALAARKTGRPAKIRLDRDDDMVMTGKRHDFEIAWSVGFDGEGRLAGADFNLASRCGHSADLSMAINDRAMFHADNAYALQTARIVSHRLRTNTVSNTAAPTDQNSFAGLSGPIHPIEAERLMSG